MATIVLSAVGFAAGNALNGTILGLSTGVIGRAIGATIGHMIDQRIMGRGSEVVETGRVDRLRLTGASEGTPIGTVYGRVRVPGHVIWATQFKEHVTVKEGSGGGKGQPKPKTPTTRSYSYSVSLAVALCEGEISDVLRVWADGQVLEGTSLNMRVYPGDQHQMPDPKIQAVEGAGVVPAYRGTAYVVIEDLDLTQFGNRIPQLTFEVVRPGDKPVHDEPEVSEAVQGVALIPGTGEYSLATTPVHYTSGFGLSKSANVNTASGKSDLLTSIDGLNAELPKCDATLMVVSWFGNDLRCSHCALKPKVEHKLEEGAGMPWYVSGTDRTWADEIAKVDGRPVYGGTPTDRSVIEGIQALRGAGKFVTFYPFILMEQLAGNGRQDPYTGAADQPLLPWRGRITTTMAPGRVGSPDGTSAAAAEVASFVGQAGVGDFHHHPEGIGYSGPGEWSYRRFILHYAHLCAKAGGVDAFCIGSEMRGFTQIRGAGNSFPGVDALIQLARDVRQILGPHCKISYAADWSEYFGYHPQDGSGDVFFHLDPLWSLPEVDFIGIDNYMPLSDWRDEADHADAAWGSVYNLDYLRANVAGGEGYDWYYPDQGAREFQDREPITDGTYGEPWVFRYKDLRNWWENTHYNRVGGARAADPTNWQPQSKPFWFTEYGCAAVDKGTNQPNKFIDPKSSESQLPYFSNGRRDDVIQAQYLRAITSYWNDPSNNPASELDGAPMVAMDKAHVWAWDARPYPYFPGNAALWSDGENYLLGHWLNGRAGGRSLDALVAEVAKAAGVDDIDVSKLYGLVRGYAPTRAGTARERLQPLMLAYGFDAIERDGLLQFRTRDGQDLGEIDLERLVVSDEANADLKLVRAPEADVSGRVRLTFIEADGDYETRSEEAIFPDDDNQSVAQSDMPLVLSRREAKAIVERWLSEARVAREAAHFALPPSMGALGAGDVVAVPGDHGATRFRIDRVEQAEYQIVEAVKIEPESYTASDAVEAVVQQRPFVAPLPVEPVFLDLPLLTGNEVPFAPHIAATARPWPGSVAVYSAPEDDGYELNTLLASRAIIGVTETALPEAKAGLMDRGAPLRVKFVYGDLASVERDRLLNGGNVAAIGDGSSANWEVFQFQTAELVGERTYDLSARLRGQLGTDGIMPTSWAPGSLVVIVNAALTQIDLAQSARGLARHYRIGPAQRSFDDSSYKHLIEAFDGVGLRPYSPAHLRALPDGSGGERISWVRRTRIDGDSWQSVEVPLGEEREVYALRIFQNDALIREVQTNVPEFHYLSAIKAADGVSSAYEIAVAQISDQFGPGPFRRMTIND
ncbi:MAG: glycoside hydrolase/phage tail family protein [Pseudomonadota bacterium]